MDAEDLGGEFDGEDGVPPGGIGMVGRVRGMRKAGRDGEEGGGWFLKSESFSIGDGGLENYSVKRRMRLMVGHKE